MRRFRQHTRTLEPITAIAIGDMTAPFPLSLAIEMAIENLIWPRQTSGAIRSAFTRRRQPRFFWIPPSVSAAQLLRRYTSLYSLAVADLDGDQRSELGSHRLCRPQRPACFWATGWSFGTSPSPWGSIQRHRGRRFPSGDGQTGSGQPTSTNDVTVPAQRQICRSKKTLPCAALIPVVAADFNVATKSAMSWLPTSGTQAVPGKIRCCVKWTGGWPLQCRSL